MVQTVTSKIVNMNTVLTVAPTPSQLQQSGALVSVGGTTLTAGEYQFCGNLAVVTTLLSSAGNFAELTNMATDFFAQGSAVGLYILELGAVVGAPAQITALQTWITANPGEFYAYLVPADWDASGADLVAIASTYASPTGRTYFFVTTTAATISVYANQKSIFAMVPSTLAPSTEFTAAMAFYQWLVNNPGAANPLAPMAYRYAYGVTPWIQANNQATITNILTAFGNLILTGAEGGISEDCLFKGTLMNGSQASWWYGIDWFQIQVKQALAAAIINGSNSNPPLLYDQNGINLLQKIAQNIANSAVTFGCALSATVTATPFGTYTTQNPNDYNAGVYNGLQATVVGQNGFLTITFNLDAVQFVV